MLDQRNKVILAGAGSVGIHFLLLLLWALSVQWFPPPQVMPPPESEPLKVTFKEEDNPTPPPESVVAPTPPPVRFKDTADMVEASTPPPDAKFLSGKNTADTSELPAEGGAAEPTQRGRIVPSFVLNTREYRPEDSAPDAAPGNTPPTPPVETAPPLPRAVPKTATLPPSLASALPPSTPPQRGDFALAAPTPTPAPPDLVEQNPYDPSIRTPASLTEPPRPTPVFASNRRSGYQPQQLKTAMSGNINNRGAGSIASVATPLGRYQSLVIESIRRRWYAYLDKRTDVASMGSVTIHFLIGMDGRARSTKVVANTANEALASISLQAILDARFPPMPADAVPDTGGGQLPMDLTFEFIDSAGF